MLVLKTVDGRYLAKVGKGLPPQWTYSEDTATKFLNRLFANSVKDYLKYTYYTETEVIQCNTY